MKKTNGFENNPCLNFKEEQIDRYTNTNCYAYISEAIWYELNGNYEITVGETAYCNTDYALSTSSFYEFYLGPLFFQVYQTKP